MPVSKRTCNQCGKTYVGWNSSKFCSDEYRKIDRPENFYRPQKKCEQCGELYKGGAESKYCSDECKRMSCSHMDGDTQLCGKCNKVKPLADFAKNKSRPSGIDHLCAPCRATYVAVKIRTPAYRFSRAKAIVKKRKKYSWELTEDEYCQLIALPCTYCGFPTYDATGIGLDRIDNTKGYSPDNVLPCCGECNRIRSNFYTVPEMKLIGKVVGRIKKDRST